MVKTSPHVYLIQIRTKDCPSDKTLREHLAKNDAAAGQQRPLPGSSEIEGGAFRARLGSGNKLRHTTVGLHINGYTERQNHEASRARQPLRTGSCFAFQGLRALSRRRLDREHKTSGVAFRLCELDGHTECLSTDIKQPVFRPSPRFNTRAGKIGHLSIQDCCAPGIPSSWPPSPHQQLRLTGEKANLVYGNRPRYHPRHNSPATGRRPG